MKIRKSFYFTSLLALLLQCCGDDKGTDCGPDPGDTYKTLNDEERSKVPYNGTETLVFISNEGDTVTLTGQGRQTEFNCKNNQGVGDCPGRGRTCYEIQRVMFKNKVTAEICSFNIYEDGLALSYPFGYMQFTLKGKSFDIGLPGLENKYYTDTIHKEGNIVYGINIVTPDLWVAFYNHNFGVLKISDKKNNNFWVKRD